jgi:hypothetical protein
MASAWIFSQLSSQVRGQSDSEREVDMAPS